MSRPLVEVGKTYKDRYGREVQILATDLHRRHSNGTNVDGTQITGDKGPILGRMAVDDSGDILLVYDENGKYRANPTYDLVIPVRYVKLDDAIAILKTRYANSNLIPELLNSLPVREIEE